MTQVTLVVSLGPEVKQVNVISYLRMTLEEAEKAATEQGLVVGTVDEEFSDDIPAGSVTYQSIPASTQVDEGTTINFRVSKGPDPSTPTTSRATQPPVHLPVPLPPLLPRGSGQPTPTYRTVQVALPDDGRESVTVEIKVGDTTVYTNVVDTKLVSIPATVYGTGIQTVSVYMTGH